MTLHRYMGVVAAVVWVASSSAQTTSLQFTEQRYAAAVTLATQGFITRAMASECFAALGKPESFVKELVQTWQQRNAKYGAAALLYMDRLLTETERTKGSQAKAALFTEYAQMVRGEGNAAVAKMLKGGERVDVCRKYLDHVQSGAQDVKPGHPYFEELARLVDYFERNGQLR